MTAGYRKGVDYCRDCWPDGWAEARVPRHKLRPVVENSGGRCATHHRENKRRQKEQSHRRRVKSQYGLAEGQYEALYEAQGGRCYICARATGASRRLSVDHDHRSGFVRGLLCRPCNSMLGHARDDLVFFQRAMSYLRHPPAYTAIGKVRPEDGDQVRLLGLQEAGHGHQEQPVQESLERRW